MRNTNAILKPSRYSETVRLPHALLVAVLAATAVAIGAARAAPQKLVFWHYLGPDSGGNFLAAMAQDFNRSQSKFEIVPQEVGDYQAMQVKVVSSLRSGGLPAMAMVDNAFFTRLALGGQLADLTDHLASQPASVTADFYPVLWEYGGVKTGGQTARYGLPLVASTQIIFYNEDALRAKNISPPRNWDEFAKAAKALSSRAAKGAILLTDAWTYGSLVASRGGNLLTADGKPDFDNPVSVDTLRYLSDLVKSGAGVPRTWGEVSFAVVDFLRTKAFMVIAPSSAYPLATRYSYAFKIGAVAFPGRNIAGEAQLVVFKNVPSDAQRAMTEYWQYVTKPDNLARFSKETFYLPVRRSAVKLMGDAAQHPAMRASLETIERSYNLPHLIEFQDWRRELEAQLERSLKGGVDPAKALAEAQRAALK